MNETVNGVREAAAGLVDQPARLGRRKPRQVAPESSAGTVEALVCRVGDERYALELSRLRGVCRATGLTPIPCTPPHVAGLLNVRGEAAVVLSLAAVIGRSADLGPAEDSAVLLVEQGGDRVGLLVDEVIEVRRFSLDQLDQPLSDQTYARGVAEASVVLLDLELVLSEQRLEVAEEIG
jgi:purine-binding chemotaxis protein CheW